METTKTTEKFQSVHKTFSYTPKSALTNQWSSLAFGIGMVIVPLIYPFGLRIRRAVILSPEVLSTILIICGALLLLMTFFSIRKAQVLAAQGVIQQEVVKMKVICENSEQAGGRYKTHIVVEVTKASVLTNIVNSAKSDEKLKANFEEGKFKQAF